MKIIQWVLTIGFILPTLLAAWTSEDIEIFKLQKDIIEETKDEKMNFYKYLSLPKTTKSNYDEITKAYKKLSRKYHPDKIRNVDNLPLAKFNKLKKKAEERFQRLSLIGTILRSEKKEKYDYYYKTGFPKLKDNEFKFIKFKPSLFLTLSTIFILVSIIHYILLKLQNSQEIKRVNSLIETLKYKASKIQTTSQQQQQQILQDKKVIHLDKFFIVKFDGSCYLIDKSPIEGEDYEIDDDGNLQYYELQDDTPRNRRERRAKLKDKSSQDVLLPITPNDIPPVVFIKDSLITRIPSYLWNSSFGKLNNRLIIDLHKFAKTTVANEEIAELDHDDDDVTDTQVQVDEITSSSTKKKGEKFTLPNGKVVYGRKRK